MNKFSELLIKIKIFRNRILNPRIYGVKMPINWEKSTIIENPDTWEIAIGRVWVDESGKETIYRRPSDEVFLDMHFADTLAKADANYLELWWMRFQWWRKRP